jgi:hypothetical protein
MHCPAVARQREKFFAAGRIPGSQLGLMVDGSARAYQHATIGRESNGINPTVGVQDWTWKQGKGSEFGPVLWSG